MKTFKPLVYRLSTHNGIFINHDKHFMSFCGVLPSLKQNFMFVLCSVHCALSNYLHVEQSELKLVRQKYRGGGNTPRTLASSVALHLQPGTLIHCIFDHISLKLNIRFKSLQVFITNVK